MELNEYEDIFKVGKIKGEWDFRIRCTVMQLPLEEINKLRAMIVAAIGTMEDMWRTEPTGECQEQTSKEEDDGKNM